MFFNRENLRRVIVAAIALPLFYLYITKLPPVFFFLLLILISVIAQVEFHSMYKTKKIISFIGAAGGVLLFFSSFGTQDSGFSHWPFTFAFMLISTVRLFLIKDPSASLNNIAPAVISFFYIPTLLISQWYLMQKGYEWILFLYGCVWASDSFAYFIGKSVGKRKLYKEVSPNKTVVGAFGSVAGGILSALLLGDLLLKGMGLPALIVMGFSIGSVTIVGDLVESMFKRDAGVKDSGSFIPGHGGVLDKIDGVLFAGPVLYWITLML
jgi:phosphatidate cytidylyltransferase